MRLLLIIPGIGLAIVRNLCKEFDGAVYLTSRNEKLGQEAMDILNKVQNIPCN